MEVPVNIRLLRSDLCTLFSLSEPKQHKVQQLLCQFPREIKPVVEGLAEATGKRVSPKTLKRLIKKTGSVWKWIRKGPAQEPAPAKYAHGQALLQLRT